MNNLVRIFIMLSFVMMSDIAMANGRSPCDRGAGGVSHCVNGKFICNDGRVSGSKKVCVSEAGITKKKRKK